MSGPVDLGLVDAGGFAVRLHPAELANGGRWQVRWGIGGRHFKSFAKPAFARAWAEGHSGFMVA